MELISKGKSHVITESWIRRWQLLSDYQSEYGNRIEWDFNQVQLDKWLDLNRKMDEHQEKLTPHIQRSLEENITIPLPGLVYNNLTRISEVYEILQQMNPTDGEYLLTCRIDKELPHSSRKQLYYDLGHYIRRNGLLHLYRRPKSRHEALLLGSYCNLAVETDPMVAMTAVFNIPIREDPELTAAMAYPYNILVGILYTALQEQEQLLSVGIGDTEELIDEVPWWLIRWDDVKTMHYTQEVADQLSKANALSVECQKESKNDSSVFYEHIRVTTALLTSISTIASIYMGHGVSYNVEWREHSNEGLVRVKTLPVNQAFQSSPELPEPLGECNRLFSLLLIQSEIVTTDNLLYLCNDVFGLDVILTRSSAKHRASVRDCPVMLLSRSIVDLMSYVISGQVTEMTSSSQVVAVWIERQISYQYGTRVVPMKDYPALMRRLLTATSQDFLFAISTLLVRMLELNVLSPYWTRKQVQKLADAALAVLD